MFLQDQDLQSNIRIADLQARLAEIESFTTVLFADIDDSEREHHENIKNRFEQLKTALFENSDEILRETKGRQASDEQRALREAQLNLMFDWEQFGLTEDMFYWMYQCHRNQNNDDLNTQKRARIIQQIIDIETNLLLLFKIRQTAS